MMPPMHALCFILLLLPNCSGRTEEREERTANCQQTGHPAPGYDTSTQTIHVFVALCDNKYQGIVPVPPRIGNGQDPANNLYWGAAYGIKTFFGRSTEWKLLRTEKADTLILERLVFRHTRLNYYLVAEAWNGKYIRNCTEQLLLSSAGLVKDTLHAGSTVIGTYGHARMLVYIGHDGLMEFSFDRSFAGTDHKQRDCIILACASRNFFSPYLDREKINPVLWTSDLMCPEAYTLHDALTGYLNHESNEQVRTRAAKAYAKYQKCTESLARNILVTGW